MSDSSRREGDTILSDIVVPQLKEISSDTKTILQDVAVLKEQQNVQARDHELLRRDFNAHETSEISHKSKMVSMEATQVNIQRNQEKTDQQVKVLKTCIDKQTGIMGFMKNFIQIASTLVAGWVSYKLIEGK